MEATNWYRNSPRHIRTGDRKKRKGNISVTGKGIKLITRYDHMEILLNDDELKQFFEVTKKLRPKLFNL